MRALTGWLVACAIAAPLSLARGQSPPPGVPYLFTLDLLPSDVMIPVLPSGAPLPVVMAEAPVVSGQVNTTLRSEFLIFTGWLQNAIGQQASYSCQLQGYSKSLQRWDGFGDNATDLAFRLRPTPPFLEGTFIW